MGNCTSADTASAKHGNSPAPPPPSKGASKLSVPALHSVTKEITDIRDLYTFEKQLGKGNFGVVHRVTDKKTGEKYACKTISKRKLVTPEDVEDVQREIQIMMHLAGNQNVVQIQGAYEDKHSIHLVMEIVEGGELFDSIAKAGHFSEKRAAEVMRTIVSVVHHCHTMNVVHRDLKPENFLLTDKGVIKATDFGLGRFWKVGEVLDEIVGSPFYVAPEVLKRAYGCEADIWSCGVILYILLCGWPPFHGDSTQQIFRNVLSAPLDLKSDPWGDISDAAKDCVRRMLTRDPRKRYTAEQVLNHPWMKVQGVASDKAFVPEILQRMANFSKMNYLKREALKVIATKLPAVELAGMREMFREMDADGSNTITLSELREGLRRKGADVALGEVQGIMDKIDLDGNARLDYEEFIAATIHLHKLEREDLLLEAFKHFDTDSSGFITFEELRAALKGVANADDKSLQDLLNSMDANGDNKIDYQEFCRMMRNNDYEQLKVATRTLRGRSTHKMLPPDIKDMPVAPDQHLC